MVDKIALAVVALLFLDALWGIWQKPQMRTEMQIKWNMAAAICLGILLLILVFKETP